MALGLVLSGALLVGCPGASALDPALDVSQYAHTSWTIREGFTKGVIFAIAQTPDGYLWLGTEFGLLRFDGVRAVPWQPPSGQHLPTNSILSLLATRDGTLWIGTWKGLASWKAGNLTEYPELSGLIVNALLEDHEGTVWAGGFTYTPPGKLCAIQKGNVHCFGEDGTLGNGALGLYEDSKGRLWAGVLSGLWRWEPGPPQFYPVAGEARGIQGMAEDQDGSLLIAIRGRVARLVDGKPVTAYPYPAGARQVPSVRMIRDRDGGLWIATPHGLVHVHRGTSDTFAQSDGLSSDLPNGFFEDREGSIWVGTSKGLDRFSAYSVVSFSEHEGLSGSGNASVVVTKDGSVWFATHDLLSRLDKGQVTIYHGPGIQAGPIPPGAEGRVRQATVGGLPKHDFASLFQDDKGRIWVGTSGGIGYLKNERFVSISGVPGGVVYAMAGDALGNLWISNLYDGLFHLLHGSLAQRIPWAALGPNDVATALAADRSQGGVWLGFSKGGLAYFKDGQILASYTPTDGLGKGLVGDLRFGSRGTLWASTAGGLSRVRDGHVVTLTSKNGLPCDGVHWSMEDDDHFVWLSMPCGLVRIARSELDASVSNPERTIQTTIFDASDGVRPLGDLGSEPMPRASKSSDGKIWFPTFDGLSVIDPRRLAFNKLSPPVHVEQITADRKKYDPASYGNGRVPLPARIRDLQIDYTALSFVAPEKVRFRYKLEGRDRDWQDVGTRRQAFYSDLPPRSYRFRVMACNNSGVWNEAGAFLDFSIAPAYYQTLWFRALCGVALAALLIGVYELRLRQVAWEYNMRVDERVNERTRIARELHDSLLQGFQGLMFRLQAVRDLLPGRAAEAMKALDIALERGDKAIVEGRDTVSDLREPIVGGKDIAEALTALGEELAFQKDNGIGPCVRVLVEGKQRDLDPVLRDEVYRIAREALRNAFRHAKAQKIEAEITYGDSEFLLHVRDDGTGIVLEVASQGARAGHWGLPGMRERAKSFGGKLEVWSQHGAGTEIELTVPAVIAYGKSNARRRFQFWRKKAGESNGQQS